MKWIDHPTLDLHLSIHLAYRPAGEQGLPGPDELQRLRALEDELVDLLDDRALLVAHLTTNGLRTLHLYADSTDVVASDRANAWASLLEGVEVEVEADPGWRSVRAYS